MEIEFKKKMFEKIESEMVVDVAHEAKLPLAVIKSAQKKLQFLRSATEEKTLRSWKSLHYEKLSGEKEGFASIRLNDQYRMVFELINDPKGLKAIVHDIKDYH